MLAQLGCRPKPCQSPARRASLQLPAPLTAPSPSAPRPLADPSSQHLCAVATPPSWRLWIRCRASASSPPATTAERALLRCPLIFLLAGDSQRRQPAPPVIPSLSAGVPSLSAAPQNHKHNSHQRLPASLCHLTPSPTPNLLPFFSRPSSSSCPSSPPAHSTTPCNSSAAPVQNACLPTATPTSPTTSAILRPPSCYCYCHAQQHASLPSHQRTHSWPPFNFQLRVLAVSQSRQINGNCKAQFVPGQTLQVHTCHMGHAQQAGQSVQGLSRRRHIKQTGCAGYTNTCIQACPDDDGPAASPAAAAAAASRSRLHSGRCSFQ